MSTAQFCVSWMSYKNSISKGLSRLQQDGEFVDMTLAADGHLVKVHQNIVALASPYLKTMIQSAQCQHPVVFFNNVSQEMLSFVLEYIYTGEVNIPTDLISTFIDVCKALCINGVENLVLPKKVCSESAAAQATSVVEERPGEPPEPADNNFAAHITINSDNYNVEVIAVENKTIQEKTQPVTMPLIPQDSIEVLNYQSLPTTKTIEDKTSNDQGSTYPAISLDVIDVDFDNHNDILENRQEHQNKNTTDPSTQALKFTISTDENATTKPTSVKTIVSSIGSRDRTQHYTMSNRGSLQLLLNRFMYYCHHHSCGGRKRRWRCVDYRRMHCPAYIDTDNDVIVNRSEAHNHACHDTKIMRKFKSKCVFTSITQAEEKLLNSVKQKAPKAARSKKREISLWNTASTM
ncbi:modifier of mdg4-like isoform X1 [Helicoverpa zea]|uniref:modifier of mdg4-like isoform X1 n=1 Tax=Helicoverpa zea TaxID=7113 RepID=UPI001F5A6FEB|nr:modifier of mdg4-like isoform X1 [Helicoverpa zea]